MPTNGLVLLVASTNGVFGGPIATNFVSSNNVVVARWDLSATGTPGQFSDTALDSQPIPTGLSAGNQLMLYWFPTLNIGSTAPGAGTSYGFYRDATAALGNYGAGLNGSDPWFVPADGNAVGIFFITTDDPYYSGGLTPATNGWASYTVPSAFSPPTVNPATYTRTSGLGYKFSIANLLTNVVDPYPSNVVVFSSVNSTSTNGITLSTNSNNEILYPSNAPNVPDSFTYTVTDTNTALSATGSVYIVIGSVTGTNSVVSLHVGVPAAGTNTLQFAGIPNYSYVTQYATNVAGPWSSFSTNTANTNGLWTVVDTTATNASRFYRAKY